MEHAASHDQPHQPRPAPPRPYKLTRAHQAHTPSPSCPPSRIPQSILGTLLFKQFNRGVLEASCDALHSLMWCENQLFQTLMTQVPCQFPHYSPHSPSLPPLKNLLLSLLSTPSPSFSSPSDQPPNSHSTLFLTPHQHPSSVSSQTLLLRHHHHLLLLHHHHHLLLLLPLLLSSRTSSTPLSVVGSWLRPYSGN